MAGKAWRHCAALSLQDDSRALRALRHLRSRFHGVAPQFEGQSSQIAAELQDFKAYGNLMPRYGAGGGQGHNW